MRGVIEHNRKPSDLEERISLHYSRIASWLSSRSWYQDPNVESAVRSLIVGRPKRVLELCCGTGLLLQELSAAYPGTEFVGSDISPKMVELARKRLRAARNVVIFQQDWINELTSEWNAEFDVIIVKNALHLLDNLPERLAALRRVSQEWTNLIVIETISPSSETNNVIKRLFQCLDRTRIKQNLFTERTLTAALRAGGWHMAQNSPDYLRQHIDTEDWIRQRSSDPEAAEKARTLLTGIADFQVRDKLDFDTPPGMFPTRMLRLQYVARHIYVPSRHRDDSQSEGAVQLQLT